MKEKLEQWFINSAIKDFERGVTLFIFFWLYICIRNFFTIETRVLIIILFVIISNSYHFFGKSLYDARLYLLIKEEGKQN